MPLVVTLRGETPTGQNFLIVRNQDSFVDDATVGVEGTGTAAVAFGPGQINAQRYRRPTHQARLRHLPATAMGVTSMA